MYSISCIQNHRTIKANALLFVRRETNRRVLLYILCSFLYLFRRVCDKYKDKRDHILQAFIISFIQYHSVRSIRFSLIKQWISWIRHTNVSRETHWLKTERNENYKLFLDIYTIIYYWYLYNYFFIFLIIISIVFIQLKYTSYF